MCKSRLLPCEIFVFTIGVFVSVICTYSVAEDSQHRGPRLPAGECGHRDCGLTLSVCVKLVGFDTSQLQTCLRSSGFKRSLVTHLRAGQREELSACGSGACVQSTNHILRVWDCSGIVRDVHHSSSFQDSQCRGPPLLAGELRHQNHHGCDACGLILSVSDVSVKLVLFDGLDGLHS